MSKTAKIINIQRLSVHDGDGLRTTVFFKGCPLTCIWCHNPESQKYENEILYNSSRCIHCGRCVIACPNACHAILDGTHVFHREACSLCLHCIKACPSKALLPASEEYTVDELLELICRDKLFYGSGGGVTFSGGEPMTQIDFLCELCKKSKAAGLNINIETCGFCPTEYFDRIMPFTDVFLYDIKAVPSRHKEFTGAESTLILKNLEHLCRHGASVILRCPIIPGCNDNDSHYRYITSLASSFPNIKRIDWEPYHALGLGKYDQLGRTALYDNPKDMRKEELPPCEIC